MKKIFITLLLVASFVFATQPVAAKEEISLSSLIELLIALNIIPSDKAEAARSILADTESTTVATSEFWPTTYDSSAAFTRYNKILSSLKTCGDGNDFYDGGAGIDTLVLRGERKDYYIVDYADAGYLFKDVRDCQEGTDSVINIERFVFADGAQMIDKLKPNLKKESGNEIDSVLSVTQTAKKVVRVEYNAKPSCDSVNTQDTFMLELGDGTQRKADCKGVVDHEYKESGSYEITYKRNGTEIANVSFSI